MEVIRRTIILNLND